MPLVLLGQVTTVKGLCSQHDLNGDVQSFYLPASSYRCIQPPSAVSLGEHGAEEVARVVHLDRDTNSYGLLAMAVVHDEAAAPILEGHRWWYSDTAQSRGDRQRSDIEVCELALTGRPGHVGTQPVVVGRSDAALPPRQMDRAWDQAWARGCQKAEMVGYRKAPPALLVHDVTNVAVAAPPPSRRAQVPARPRATMTRPAPVLRVDGVKADAVRTELFYDLIDSGVSLNEIGAILRR